MYYLLVLLNGIITVFNKNKNFESEELTMEKNTKKVLQENVKITDEEVCQLLEETEEINAEGEVNGLGCLTYCN